MITTASCSASSSSVSSSAAQQIIIMEQGRSTLTNSNSGWVQASSQIRSKTLPNNSSSNMNQNDQIRTSNCNPGLNCSSESSNGSSTMSLEAVNSATNLNNSSPSLFNGSGGAKDSSVKSRNRSVRQRLVPSGLSLNLINAPTTSVVAVQPQLLQQSSQSLQQSSQSLQQSSQPVEPSTSPLLLNNSSEDVSSLLSPRFAWIKGSQKAAKRASYSFKVEKINRSRNTLNKVIEVDLNEKWIRSYHPSKQVKIII